MSYITPFYESGGRLTGHVAAGTVVAGTFVDVYAGRQPGGSPALSTDSGANAANGGNYQITTATAATRGLGVAEFDGALGSKVTVIADPGTVVPVLVGATAIVATANRLPEVEIGADGKVVPLAEGIAVGKALAPAAVGAFAEIKLY